MSLNEYATRNLREIEKGKRALIPGSPKLIAGHKNKNFFTL